MTHGSPAATLHEFLLARGYAAVGLVALRDVLRPAEAVIDYARATLYLRTAR